MFCSDDVYKKRGSLFTKRAMSLLLMSSLATGVICKDTTVHYDEFSLCSDNSISLAR